MPYEEDIFHSIEMDENTLSHNVAQRIRSLILSGELSVGDRLPPEHELCERLGVSRTVIREAIIHLKAIGMLKGRIGVGTYITHPSMNILGFSLQHMQMDYKKMLVDLQQVRLALEPSIAAMVAKNANTEDISALELTVKKMQANLNDSEKYIELDNIFHLSLAKVAGNSVLELFVSSTVDLLQQARKLYIQSTDAIPRSNIHHGAILEAVKARDSQRAFQAMEAHMDQIFDSFQTATQDLEQSEIACFFEQVRTSPTAGEPMNSSTSKIDQTGLKTMVLNDGLLSHQVAGHIRSLIRNGKLKCGDQLPSERELSDALEVSRTIVREAINLLKASGVIWTKPGVGTFVTTPSINVLEVPLNYLIHTDAQKIKELQQARQVFEPVIVVLAAQASLPEDLANIQTIIEGMRQYLVDPLRYMQLDQSFHLALTLASHNSIFALCMNSIIDLLKEEMWLAVHAPGAIERSLRYHEQILAAIQAKDSQLARKIMEDHLQQATMDIMSLLQS